MPDSRHILYARPLSSLQEVVLRDTESLAAHAILRSENTMLEMSVSPDGTRMAYNSGTSNLGFMELSIDTGAVQPIRVTRINEPDVADSPARDRDVYVGYGTGRAEIMLREMSGSGPTQLTFGSPVAGGSMFQARGGPVFSPDGRRIAFSQSGQIWSMPSTGGQAAPITPTQADGASAPAWSLDGRWIAYQRGLPGNRELVKIDSSGQGEPVTVSQRPASGTVSIFTRWSTGGQIAYLGKDSVRICDEGGRADRLLVPTTRVPGLETAGPQEAIAGDFSHRGDLFYGLKREGEKWMLATVEVRSGRVLRTVAAGDSSEAGIFHAWLHPDGKRMVYTRSELSYDIWMLEGLARPESGWMRIFRHWGQQ